MDLRCAPRILDRLADDRPTLLPRNGRSAEPLCHPSRILHIEREATGAWISGALLGYSRKLERVCDRPKAAVNPLTYFRQPSGWITSWFAMKRGTRRAFLEAS
jgi:hypothetical protein